MTIKGRILTFLKEQGISREDFYRNTELSASNFKGVALKSELGGDKIAKILTTYKELSPEWLLIGEGSMLKQNVLNDKNTDNTLVSNDKDRQNKRINQEEISYIYKIYQEEREEKKKMLEEKDAKIDQLQSELRQQSAELAALKARYPESPTARPEGLDPSETASHAHSHPHSPTSEHYYGGSCPSQQENQ